MCRPLPGAAERDHDRAGRREIAGDHGFVQAVEVRGFVSARGDGQERAEQSDAREKVRSSDGCAKAAHPRQQFHALPWKCLAPDVHEGLHRG